MYKFLCADTGEEFDDYKEYLKSKHWRKKRLEVFKERGRKCEMCECKKSLEVHHITYERVGNELNKDLMILCRKHHSLIHGIKPSKKVKTIEKQSKPKPKNKKKSKYKYIDKKTFGWQEMKAVETSPTCCIKTDINKLESKKRLTNFDKEWLMFCKNELLKRNTH